MPMTIKGLASSTQTFLRREGLIILLTTTLTAALLLTSAWLQMRLETQVTATDTFHLNRSLLGHLKMHAGDHALPQGFRDDPSEMVLLPDGLQQLRRVPGVAEVAGFERRALYLEVGPTNARKRIAVDVVAVPKGFFFASGISGAEAEHALAAGQAVMPKTLLDRERLTSLLQPGFILTVASNALAPSSGVQGMVAAIPKHDLVETALSVQALRLPEGMASFENVVFIGMDHALRSYFSIYLPESSLWIRLRSDADPATATHAVREYLLDSAPRVFKNSHIELQNLGEMMAGQVGIKELRRMQMQMLAGAMAALLSLVAALVFVRWGHLLHELALRQALGQGRALAVFKSSRTLLRQILLGTVLGMLLASLSARCLWQTSVNGLVLQAERMMLVAFLAGLLMPLCAWWASRRMPMQTLNIGRR